MAAPQTWRAMVDWIVDILERRTGEGLETWNRRVAASGTTDEAGLRAWLTEQGVTGYPRMLLVMERFGYPDHLTAGVEELIGGQYADRPALRPVLDAVLAQAPSLGELLIPRAVGVPRGGILRSIFMRICIIRSMRPQDGPDRGLHPPPG